MPALPVLIVYATREGHTQAVASRLASLLAARGVPSVVEDAEARPAPFDPRRYSAAILAGSVHFGRHAHALADYIVTNRVALAEAPTLLVSISMSEAIAHYTDATAAQRSAARARAHAAVDTLFAETKFRPSQIQLLGGALPYTRLGFFTRRLVKMISGREGGPTDTSRDHDLTSWPVVDALADVVARWASPTVPSSLSAP